MKNACNIQPLGGNTIATIVQTQYFAGAKGITYAWRYMKQRAIKIIVDTLHDKLTNVQISGIL